MKHEYHGFTHAVDHNEMERNKKNGWVVEAPAKVEAVEEEVVQKKRGRPPK